MICIRTVKRTDRAYWHLLANPAVLIALSWAMCSMMWLGKAQAQTNNYDIGVGIYDVTGQIAETNFFGYAKLTHRNNGLRDRQYARAFIVQEPGQTPVVFVSIDKGAMFQSVNEAVMGRLRSTFGSLYTDDNVVISATHTHVAAGGVSHFELYDTSTGGYWRANFDNMVEGIYMSIVHAHNNLAPGRIYYNRGSLTNASINRSIEAYLNNDDYYRFPDIDPEMTVLKFVQGRYQEVGMISWFPVHPVNLPQTWKLNSTDNKGWGQIKFERLKGSTYSDVGAFVAAFAQSNAGDMSPNLNQPAPGDRYTDASGPGRTPEESLEIIGERQFQKALSLYNTATEQLKGSVRFVSRNIDMSDEWVSPQYTDGSWHKTCPAALGSSFAAGAEDGRSGISREGITKNPEAGLEIDRCHAEKPIFFFPGRNTSNPEVPHVVSTTLLKIGRLGILAAPAEFTIMAGRRARAAVEEVTNDGITTTVLAGYADAYNGYVTTREEYALQHYEGASTLYGPWTCAAYAQQFHRLALKIANPSSNPWSSQEPRLLSKPRPALDKTVNILFDDKPLFAKFGDVVLQPDNRYYRGNTVRVTFQGGHPNNNLKVNGSYLFVQRWNSSTRTWEDYMYDRDQSTKLIWERRLVSHSWNHVEWKIPRDTPAGYYRIRHDGHWKNGWNGRIRSYSGTTRYFYVR